MITGFRSIQDQGKTLSMVAAVWDLVLHHGYDPREVYGNLKLDMPGSNFLSNADMRELMGVMVLEEWRHKIVLIDEINRVYPARLWTDKDRTLELLNVWHDQKMFHQIMYTTHVGTSVDVLVREATQFYVVPKYAKDRDMIDITVVNELDLLVYEMELYPASWYFPKYDRWAAVN